LQRYCIFSSGVFYFEPPCIYIYIYRSGERGGRKMWAGKEWEKKRGEKGSVRKPR